VLHVTAERPDGVAEVDRRRRPKGARAKQRVDRPRQHHRKPSYTRDQFATSEAGSGGIVQIARKTGLTHRPSTESRVILPVLRVHWLLAAYEGRSPTERERSLSPDAIASSALRAKGPLASDQVAKG